MTHVEELVDVERLCVLRWLHSFRFHCVVNYEVDVQFSVKQICDGSQDLVARFIVDWSVVSACLWSAGTCLCVWDKLGLWV
jgi:hypothetical protein